MEDVPPSYESAVSRDAWEIVAPWISSTDLCSAALVSKKWYTTFAPFLWGNPASHFGNENDAVYVALTRFKRTLRKARLAVRQLTHTLHLPPALSEIYGGPNEFWLRDVLEHLPNLQSLIVNRLPFFDHPSLLALRKGPGERPGSPDHVGDSPQYGLKLLLAEREPNTTSAGLREALFHFTNLVYLDFSYTTPAKDRSVISALAGLWHLQVLKLRAIGLRDSEAILLAETIGVRVRVLDLRDNQLTDTAITSLLNNCFLPADRFRVERNSSRRQIEDWPVGIPPGPDLLSLESLRSEDLDRELVKQLTHPLTGRLAFEDIPHKGLTHLYVANNHISVRGLSGLLKSRRLHILDGGSVQSVSSKASPRSWSPFPDTQNEDRSLGAETLIPVIIEDAKSSLTYLRAHNSVLSETALTTVVSYQPKPSTIHSRSLSFNSAAELPPETAAIYEAPAPCRHPVELPTEHDAIFELSGESAVPRSELPGDCVHFALSPAINMNTIRESEGDEQENIQPKRADGVYAPELAPNGATDAIRKGGYRERPRISGLDYSGRSLNQEQYQTARCPPSPPAALLSHIDTLERKRPPPLTPDRPPGLDEISVSHPRKVHLHPSHIPHLRTLILTDVPARARPASSLITTLINYISACADEAHLAHLQAQTSYSLPPGHSRRAAELHYCRSLFALRTIVLEVESADSFKTHKGKAWDHSRAGMSMLRSSTGDIDSEALWSAAENDFSFFGEAGEEKDECGIYPNEPEKYFPTAPHTDEKIPWDPSEETDPANSSPRQFPPLRPSSTLHPPTTSPAPAFLQSPRDLPLGRNRATSSPRRGTLTQTSPRNISPSSNPSGNDGRGPSPSPRPTPTSHPEPGADEATLDVVAELAKFRKERRKVHEQAILKWTMPGARTGSGGDGEGEGGATIPFTPGHWDGEIKIVRNATPKGRTGVVDTYGNFFENGYLYP